MTDPVEAPPEVPARPARRRRAVLGDVSGWWAVPVVLAAAVIAVFADPAAGFDLPTLLEILKAFVALLVFNLLGVLVVRICVPGPRRPRGRLKKSFLTGEVKAAPGDEAVASWVRSRVRVSARPLMLVILAIAVLFARLTGVQPALIVGQVLVVDHGDEASKGKDAARAIVAFAYSSIIGIAAWIGYWLIESQANGFTLANASFGQLGALRAVQDVLSMLAIAALASAPIALLPVSFLDGAAIWRWSKWAWGVCYVLALALFSYFVVQLPESWSEPPSGGLIAWCAVFGAYCVIAIGVWLGFRLTAKRTT